MDTVIAVIIIALAVAWVGRKIYKQVTAKGGCCCSGGCSTDCASGCSTDNPTGKAEDSACSCGDSCTCDKET